MSEKLSNNKRIAKNTLMLYIRMLVTMCVTFYTSRVVLATLGVEDYGIYNVVGGVAAMFAFLNGSLSGATSRFLTFALGENNSEKLKSTFSAALSVHVFVAIIVFLLCETVGLWLLETKLVIPEERMNAARVLFQFTVLSSILSITQVPYTAAVIAHERMDIFAYFSLGDVILKLLIVYLLMIVSLDKLVLYGALLFVVSFILLMANRIYDTKKFEECGFRLSKDTSYILPMLKFSGFDLFGNFSVMMRTQGINTLQNIFWGPAINAATGVANQVMNAIIGFSNNFLTAIRPRIVKLYAQNDIREMQRLAERGSKYSFFLLYFISFPCFLEISYILDLWLVQVPDFTKEFLRLTMIFNWINTLFIPLLHIIHATGRIKHMSIINGIIFVLVVPITYLLYKYSNLPPITPFVLVVLCVIITSLINLYIVKHNIATFNALKFVKSAIFESILVCAIGSIIPVFIHIKLNGHLGFFCTCASSTVSLGLSVLFVGLTKHEREVVFTGVLKKLHIRK